MVLQEQAQELITRWIEPHPRKRGVEEARLREYNISVWALIGALRMYGDDVEGVAGGYRVPVEAVQAAQAYYQQHQCAIDARLAANAA